MEKEHKKVIIIGAGPAGLTSGYELLKGNENIEVKIYEADSLVGGISKTINYKGNRIDIGGHRFFSKSDRVVKWWEEILPLQGSPAKDDIILNREIPLSTQKNAPDPEKTDRVMLTRNRLSRIFFLKKYFDYPISLKKSTVINLGVIRMVKIGSSYLYTRLFPIKKEKSLEDFFINRFGRELYKTFFRDYTEKLWGVPCHNIKPEWGAQRIKGLSVSKVLTQAVKSIFHKNTSAIPSKNIETSLIDQFMYPKLGPGQMWEEVAEKIKNKGGKINTRHKIIEIKLDSAGKKIEEVKIKNELTGEIFTEKGDYFLSTMPVKELISSMKGNTPDNILRIANGLKYRDFITVGLLLKNLREKNNTEIKTINNIIPDNWIYIQEKEVKIGRLQIFNNWSPYMVKDMNTVWIGLEYFCDEGDELWNKSDREMTLFAINELEKIGFIEKENVLDSVVIRVPKAYPAYFGTYDEFDEIRNYTDKIKNLFLIGRNGMHRYNNQDHSMLTAMEAVSNIKNNIIGKENIWDVNTEKDYHEEKKN